MRTPGAVALRTRAIDSATTSRPSGFSRVMPISVSVPNWMSIAHLFLLKGFVLQSLLCPSFGRKANCEGPSIPGLNGIGLARFSQTVRRQPDNIARIEVRQLEPILGDIARREQVVFAIFLLQGVFQILEGERRLCFFGDRPLDGKFFGTLDD